MFRSFAGPNQAYKLAFVLTGKDFSAINVTPLVEALVGILESADVCSDTGAPLQSSTEFRSSAENVETPFRLWV